MEPEQNTPTPENAFPPASEESSKNTLLIGGVAVLLILAGLGWYMMQSMNTMTDVPTPTPEVTQVVKEATTTEVATPVAAEDAATAALGVQGTSDEIADIEADLKATNLESLNEIEQI